MSYWQERLHRGIVGSADALTFPSRRLLEWVCSGELGVYREKGWVLPHLAMEIRMDERMLARGEVPPALSDSTFSIVHTGSLLRHRPPWVLLEGFRAFLEEGSEQRESARLVFLGNVHDSLRQSSRWADMMEKNIVLSTERVDYLLAQECMRRATVAVVLEADAAESPFFPAKLADYLWLGKPILALSPAKSVVADILGEEYEFRVSPRDAEGVSKALKVLWRYWKERRLVEVVPGEQALSQVTEGAFGITMSGLLGECSKRRRVA
jgi:hypothetical protein